MMTRKTRLTIIILALLAFLLIAVWLIMAVWPQEEVAPVVVEEPASEVVVDTKPSEVVTKPQTEVERVANQQERNKLADLNAVAKTFVERFGSYSNEANFANLTDVYPIMTASFVEEIAAFVESAEVPEEYYGVTTNVISVQSESLDEELGVATLRITTQREESIDSPIDSTIKYQDIVVDMERVAGNWMVNGAVWQ